MSWQTMIPGCFGKVDMKFAEHPEDQKRAKRTIKAAYAGGASFDDFEKEIVWHCYKGDVHYDFLDHVGKQVESARKMWKRLT